MSHEDLYGLLRALARQCEQKGDLVLGGLFRLAATATLYLGDETEELFEQLELTP